jgi:hypothetical protein
MIARLALFMLALAALLIMGPSIGAGIGTGAGWGMAFLGAGAGIALVILAAGMVYCEYRSRQWAGLLRLYEIEQAGRALDVTQCYATFPQHTAQPLEVSDYADVSAFG